ncbi:hypothetical protein MNBD_CPR01-455 [hydrothermal vent metagenome]|uniref:Uncharacterized protein n=1 Tax=hydrothermal vent metagenome TaxID=652676 RepID=A0A3B0UP84_9ZZZZ
MHHKLRELAKIATGLVIADALTGAWLASMGLLPISFFGITFTQTAILPGIIFDSVLALLLAHYGWGIKLPVRTLRERTMLRAIGTLLAIVAIGHWSRIAFGVDIVIDGWLFPVWLSWFAVTITTYLSYVSFHFSLKRHH